MKTQFKLIENEHTPMADYEVVQFARDSDIGFKTKVPELKVVQGWLFSKGYDEKKNFISPEDLTSLKTVITHYYGTLGPFDYTMNFSDLFNIVGENQSGAYWLNRRGKHSQYVAPTRRTLEAIA